MLVSLGRNFSEAIATLASRGSIKEGRRKGIDKP